MTVYISCKVLPGLFDNEFYVMVNGSSAYYIHQTNVDVQQRPKPGEPVDGRVRGFAVAEEKGKILVQMPGEPVVGGVRTWVETEAVTAA